MGIFIGMLRLIKRGRIMNNVDITLKNINSVLYSNEFDDKTKIELLKEAVKVLEENLNNT